MAELNLVQKLAKIRAMSDAVVKEKKGYNYSYADITTILANITAGMKENGVSLIPSIVPGTANVVQNVVTNTQVDKTGNHFNKTTTEMLVTAEMTFTWVNDENPNEKLEVPWFLTGSQSDPSQAYGSGLTYCTRYFLTNFFEIALIDPKSDVDEFRSKQKAAAQAEDIAVAEAVITQFDKELKAYLAEHPEQKDSCVKMVSRYAKGAQYSKIKDPQLAAKLLEEFHNTYMKGEQGDA